MNLEELSQLVRRHKHDGIETEGLTFEGLVAPSFKPKRVGLIYCDTVAGKVYISTGTLDATSWKILN